MSKETDTLAYLTMIQNAGIVLPQQQTEFLKRLIDINCSMFDTLFAPTFLWRANSRCGDPTVFGYIDTIIDCTKIESLQTVRRADTANDGTVIPYFEISVVLPATTIPLHVSSYELAHCVIVLLLSKKMGVNVHAIPEQQAVI